MLFTTNPINRSNQIIESVTPVAQYKIKVLVDNVAGVKIPIFDKIPVESSEGMYCCSGGRCSSRQTALGRVRLPF